MTPLFPYARWEIVLVYVLCTLPLARLLSDALQRTAPRLVGPAAIGLWMGVFAWAAIVPAAVSLTPASWFLITLGRTVGALWLALACAATSRLFWKAGTDRSGSSPGPGQGTGVRIALALLAWMCLPLVCVTARCTAFSLRLQELTGQGRLAEARDLARQLLVLNPAALVQQRPLQRVQAELEQQVAEFQRHVASPLPAGSSLEQRIDRARALAVLNRRKEAVALLAKDSAARPVHPAVAGLLGVISEADENWSAAWDWNHQAREAWQAAPPSEARQAGMYSAVRGQALAERKLGRYRAAAATYEELLQLDPSAETHFLLAQFYEDTQQADQAALHLQQAVILSPSQFGREGERLLDQLATQHFGCLTVPRSLPVWRFQPQ